MNKANDRHFRRFFLLYFLSFHCEDANLETRLCGDFEHTAPN